jgi:hypothetical protein
MDFKKQKYNIFINIASKKTIYFDINNEMTINDLIELIKNKVLKEYNINLFKFKNTEIQFKTGSKIVTFDEDDLSKHINDSSFNNFFNENSTYNIQPKINIHEAKKDTECLAILNQLFNYFYSITKNNNENIQIIIPLYSANISDSITKIDVLKNIKQQFQYDIISSSKIIIYVLIDRGFFIKEKGLDVFQLLNCKELKLPSLIETKSPNLKLYQLKQPYSTSYTPPKYEEVFNELVEWKIRDKKVYFFVLKCNVDSEIEEYLKEYKDVFYFRAFSGGDYFTQLSEWRKK